MLARLDLDCIVANPDQPRKTFDPKALAELADSIAKNGLLQPITVRPIGPDQYEIVAGERRYRAHRILRDRAGDFRTIPCHVKRMDDQKRDIAAIIENLQRADVTPLEEADAFARLASAGMSAEDIADKIGVAAFRVRWRLQLLNLAPDIRSLFASGNLDRQQAMELSRLPEHRDQHRILTLIRTGRLNGWKAVRNAVDASLDRGSQSDMFGGQPAESEIAAVNAIEQRIDSILRLAANGWKDGECVIATKVGPDRASTVADKLSAAQKALRIMERELRNTLGQASAAFAA